MIPIKILKHDCKIWKIVSNSNENCPFYFKKFNAHWFTLFGIRVIIGSFK